MAAERDLPGVVQRLCICRCVAHFLDGREHQSHENAGHAQTACADAADDEQDHADADARPRRSRSGARTGGSSFLRAWTVLVAVILVVVFAFIAGAWLV